MPCAQHRACTPCASCLQDHCNRHNKVWGRTACRHSCMPPQPFSPSVSPCSAAFVASEGTLQLTVALSMVLQQHQYMSQMSPGSPMYGSNSLASATSMFHMSQSSGSPNFSYPYSHWYWPQPPSPPLAAPGAHPFMQAQYAASNTFSSGNHTQSKLLVSGAGLHAIRLPFQLALPVKIPQLEMLRRSSLRLS